MDDLSGRQLGPYHILEPLREGGMAAVFKAYQPNVDRHVAVKVLPSGLAQDPEFVGRFRQEAMVLAKLQHPHILPVFDYGTSDAYTYLVMPLIESGTLKELLTGEPLSLEQIRDLGSQVGDALDYAHSRGLVHRDVKPSNVLLDERGNCLLTDFGIAKILESTARFTSTGGTVGTPAYMSPEQGRGDPVSARADIYALGVILYEMATGRVPFEAETPVAVIFKHIEEPLPPPRALRPELPEALESVIVKALAKSPQERYETAGELVSALRSAVAVGAPPPPRQEAVPRQREVVPPEADRAPRLSPGAWTGRALDAVRKGGAQTLPSILLIASLLSMGAILFLTAANASRHGPLRVPFASWFVLALGGLILALNGITFYFRRRFRRAEGEINVLLQQPLEDEIPTVCGHSALERAEFLTIIQILFRHPFDAKYVQVWPLPGGYGGGTTVLTELRRRRDAAPAPRSFVLKLGARREMEQEQAKFQRYVLTDLAQAARFFRYAAWEEWAGIAYEFVGLDPDHEIQSFYQFYSGYATVEVVELLGQVYHHLERAWYRDRQAERVDLYRAYDLLNKKQSDIIGQIGEIVGEEDPYRANLAALERRLRPHLRPGFCPDLDIPWYDPVAFLRTWSRRQLETAIYRSVVHGDLNARNVLVEIERGGAKRVWFIDFSHTGNGLSAERAREASQEGLPIHADRGHVLRDFCRLEAEVKFLLTPLQDEQDLRKAVAFENELLACGLAPYDAGAAPTSVEALRDERFRKAWQVVREVRRRAAAYLAHAEDLRPYYVSLLHATLPVLYYHPGQFGSSAGERQQKRYALLAAGMLCGRL